MRAFVFLSKSGEIPPVDLRALHSVFQEARIALREVSKETLDMDELLLVARHNVVESALLLVLWRDGSIALRVRLPASMPVIQCMLGALLSAEPRSSAPCATGLKSTRTSGIS